MWKGSVMTTFHYTRALFVPCPSCGHKNKIAKTTRETVKKILSDELPVCKKCKTQLEGRLYDLTGIPYVNEVKRELGII